MSNYIPFYANVITGYDLPLAHWNYFSTFRKNGLQSGEFKQRSVYRYKGALRRMARLILIPEIRRGGGSALGVLLFTLCYASAFRRRRHYVFGLSVRPSVHPSEAWNTLFWPVHVSSGYVRRLPPDRGIRDRKVSLHSMVLWRFYSETENYIVRPHTTTTQEQVPRSLLNRATSDPRAQTNAFHLRRLLICQNALANTFWPA